MRLLSEGDPIQRRLFQAALELLAERGYRGATTREIARRAGVSEVTLFRRFGSHLHPRADPGAGRLRNLRLRLPRHLPLRLRLPYRGHAPFFQALSYLVPARYLIEVLRGVMLKGVGWEVLWPDLLALALFAVLVLFLASVRFRRQVAV